MLKYTIDRARPGLVNFHGIRPGNGAGLFLQPRSPHGATTQYSGINLHFQIEHVPSSNFSVQFHVLESA